MEKLTKFCSYLLLFCFAGSFAFAAEIVNAPVYKNGDMWVFKYQRQNSRISKSNVLQGGDYKFLYENGQATLFCDDGTICNMSQDDGRLFTILYGNYKEVVWLKFPLAVGSSWAYRYFNDNVGAGGLWVDGQAKVLGTERLNTPAGNFDVAYKIVRSEGTGTAQKNATYYYVPKCECIAVMSMEVGAPGDTYGNYNTELLSYKIQ